MAKIHRIKKSSEEIEKRKSRVKPNTPVSDDGMARLALLMNDSPTIIKLYGTEWQITALKPAVQMLISEEACKVVAKEKASMGDVIRQFATNLSSVTHILTLALLNDKHRIFSDYEHRKYSEEYYTVYDTLMWGDYQIRDWALLLGEILDLIGTDFFFESINVIKTVREMTLGRKTTKAEQG